MKHTAAIKLLDGWLQTRLAGDEKNWLDTQIDKSLQSNSGKDLYITLGLVPRKLSRQDLGLSQDELVLAQQARAGWDPSRWSIAGAARILVLAKVAQTRSDSFGRLYQEMCRTADVTESIELYSALPLLPASAELDQQVGEGLRTNMKAIFEAIAHRNPYPQETFDENRWNHMVLKALFVDSTLAPIQGLDERANDELAGILCDYAHERWAANRAVTCELWRCVGPFAKAERLNDLARALRSDDADKRHAAAIAILQSPQADARSLLSEHPKLADSIATGKIYWTSNQSTPVVTNQSAVAQPG